MSGPGLRCAILVPGRQVYPGCTAQALSSGASGRRLSCCEGSWHARLWRGSGSDRQGLLEGRQDRDRGSPQVHRLELMQRRRVAAHRREARRPVQAPVHCPRQLSLPASEDTLAKGWSPVGAQEDLSVEAEQGL